MTINAHLDDLSDEGLDLLLRIALSTDVRQIDDWRSIGALIEARNITVSNVKDSLWSAEIPDDASGKPYESEFGRNPRAAVACTLIRAYFPDGPAFRVPRDKAAELFTDEFLESTSWQLGMQLEEMEQEGDGKVSVVINYP